MNIQEFYKAFYNSRWYSVSFTREKSSASWSQFWYLVIVTGFKFQKNDLVDLRQWPSEENLQMFEKPRIFHWPREGHYSVAIADSNTQFCIAYEALVGRKPFITKDIYYSDQSGLVCHSSKKTQGRLSIRDQFNWKGFWVEVTSFNDEKGALVACAYDEKKDKYGYRVNNKPIKVFTITNKDLLEERKKIKTTKI